MQTYPPILSTHACVACAGVEQKIECRSTEVRNGLSKVRFNQKETRPEVRGQEELEYRHLGLSPSDLYKTNFESFYQQLLCWRSLGWGPRLGGVNLGVEGWHGQSVRLRVGELVGGGGESCLQDRDKFRGESIGSALTSLPLFVTAAVFKAWNLVPVQRWKNSKQVY